MIARAARKKAEDRSVEFDGIMAFRYGDMNMEKKVVV